MLHDACRGSSAHVAVTSSGSSDSASLQCSPRAPIRGTDAEAPVRSAPHGRADQDDAIFEGWVIEAIDALPAVVPRAPRQRRDHDRGLAERRRSSTRRARPACSACTRACRGRRSARTTRRSRRGSRSSAGPIEQWYRDEASRRAKVIDTVHHEIAHHFGISRRPPPRARGGRRRAPHLSAAILGRVDAQHPARRGRPVDPRGDRPRPARRRVHGRPPRPTASRASSAGAPTVPISSCSTSCSPAWTASRSAARSAARRRRRSSCSRRAPTRSTSWSASSRAPTTTSASRSSCRSSWRGSGRRSGAGPTAGGRGPGATGDHAGRRSASTSRAGPSTRDGADIPLTRTEFDLLVELAAPPGPGVHPRRAARPRLGLRLPRRLAAGRRRRRAAAGEGRGRPGRPGAGPDGARRPATRPRGAGRLTADHRAAMTGLRTRLAVTLVLLVALTVAAIGVGVYAFVDASLRGRALADARQQADFNLSVLLPGAGPAADGRRRLRRQRPPGGVPAARRGRHDRRLRRRQPVHARAPPRRARRALARPARDRRARRSSATPGRRSAASRSLVVGGRQGGGAGPVLRVPDGRRRDGARAAPARARSPAA